MSMYKNIDYFKERENMKQKFGFDTVCTAKFFTSTIYLQNGQTHSCYHPLPHDIPLEELDGNPAALHNTKHKIQARKEMMTGSRPEECNYCWRVEDMGDEYLSDRIIKSKNELLLTPSALEEIKENGWDHNYRPTYLEIAFGNECNMKCAYCHPKASSTWMKEMRDHGPMPKAPHLQQLHETIYPEDNNPYLDAFWDWWLFLRKRLKVLRLTGGEPLLQQSIWKFLDMLDKHPCPDLVFQLNSNFNVKNKLVKRFCDKVNKLLDAGKIQRFQMFTSLESWGPKAEYARSGLNLALFEENLDTVLMELGDQPPEKFAGVTIMNTFNILSVTSYTEFLEKIIEWRKKYVSGGGRRQVKFDIPHCTEPNHWTLVGLPDEYDTYFELITQFFETYSWKNNWNDYPQEQHDLAYYLYFSDEELKAWKRVNDYWKSVKEGRNSISPPDYLTVEKVDDARRNWYLFIDETDRRRGTDFLSVFPEMKDYYILCSSLEDLDTRFYNQQVRNMMMSPGQIEVHFDDDFFWHHPKLAHNLVNFRKVRSFRTVMFDNNKPVGEFGG